MPEFTVTTTMDSTEKKYCLLNDILECQKDAFLSNISFDTDVEFNSTGTAIVHVKAYYSNSSSDDCAETHVFNTTFDFSVNNNSNIVKLNKLQNFIKNV